MRAFPAAAAAVLAITAPSMAFAQEDAPPGEEAALAALSDKLADPQVQAQAAVMAQALVSALLDLEVGPLADAVDRATDGKGPAIDPDARVRDLAPEAEELPDQIAQKLPEAMATMSVMSDGMQDMLPAFRDMAEKMREAMAGVRDIR